MEKYEAKINNAHDLILRTIVLGVHCLNCILLVILKLPTLVLNLFYLGISI